MTPWALGLLYQVKFDWSVSVGNIVTGLTFAILCAVAWKDLVWRVKNLEIWRKEHMIDADARDKILLTLELVGTRLELIVKSLSDTRTLDLESRIRENSRDDRERSRDVRERDRDER